MEIQDNFIYYPSLSCGNSKHWLEKDWSLENGDTCRFYDDRYPEKFRHKTFLVSYGHNRSKHEVRKDLGLEESLVIGDSGGFQLMTGAMKWQDDTPKKVLTWLENNSDVAMNLDIPPRGKIFGYNESLQMSVDNFKYFEKNRTGKCDLLNVLHGQTKASYEEWYNHVKDFKFEGWSLGGAINDKYQFLYAVALLMEKGEFDKDHIKYLHILGSASVSDFFMLGCVQKFLHKKYGKKIQVSTDSSSSNRATIYGMWFYDINWKSVSQVNLYFGKDGRTDYNLDAKLPCRLGCPGCENITYRDIEKYDERTYMQMTNHNLAFLLNAYDTVNLVLNSHEEMIREIFGSDFYKMYKSVEELFESKHPIATFNKYEKIYAKFGKMNEISVNDSKVNEFFEINK